MSDIGEGLGVATQGSLFARALEPDAGTRDPHPHQPSHCLNCGTELVGAYCHSCGQLAHLHRTIGAFMHDLLHGALHFEGKMWHTVPLLVFKPGTLTRRYIEGARARFVSPMALFLFSVFLMFAVFQALGITAPTDIALSNNMVDGLESARQIAEDDLDESRTELAAMAADDPERAALEAQIAEAEEGLDGLAKITPVVTENGDGSLLSANLTGIEFIDSTLVKKWREHPDLMLYKLQANSYKFSWLLIPLSIPFVWMLFVWKRRFNGYDHAIFVTYSLSFMSLLFVTLSILRAAGASSDLLELAAVVIPPIHIYKQMRGAYSLSRFSALWRLSVLLIMITIIIVLFLQILMVLGAF